MNKFNSILLFVVSLIIVIPVVIFIYPEIHPYTGLKNIIDKESIESRAKEIITEEGVSPELYKPSTGFTANEKLLRQSQEINGLSKSNKLIAEGMSGYRWKVRWRKNEEDSSGGGSRIKRQLAGFLGDIRMEFDPKGNLLRYEIEIGKKAKLPVVTESNARIIANKFIKKYSNLTGLERDTVKSDVDEISDQITISLNSEKGADVTRSEIDKGKRTDYQFDYVTHDELTGNDVKVSISVKGNKISEFTVQQEIPKEFDSSPLLPKLFSILFGVVIVIIMFITAFKKFRAYEIGFKAALFMGTISALGLLSEIIFETSGDFEWEMLIGWILGPLLIGLGVTVIWAVSEATGREVWREKYTEFDLLVNGHYLHSNLGNSVLTGFSSGFIVIGLWAVLIFIADQLFNISMQVAPNGDSIFIGGSGPVYLLGQGIYKTVFTTAVNVAFILSLLKKRFDSNLTILLFATLIWALPSNGSIEPFGVNVVLEFIIAVLIMYVFIRYNLLAAFVVILTYGVMRTGLSYFFITSNDMTGVDYYLIAMLAVPVVYGFVSMLTKDKLTDLDTITPAFAKNITERQRLQGEIEAAKSIQESFLPSETPSIPGLDIAAKCLPALEVGGDYYDFVKHDSNKLSIIIGDVAGKGTKAAFVMTLTKGFFKALSRTMAPPSKILSEINEMFYENVGRGSFISAIFGVFDLEQRKFTYARAGHNPLLFIRADDEHAKFLQPEGIALGMEKGILFSKTIQEESIELQSGDLFVLYTDGFTEAMNSQDVQFGEEALQKLVEANKDKSSQQLMEILFTETLKHIGRAKQYDDMTIMVLKVE